MANTLMFEVGIKSAQEQLEKIKQEFTKANGELSKLLNIKVSIDGLDAVTKALSQIGDTSALSNLRTEIAALNREFSILSKGAGGSGDMASRGLSADIEKTTQSIDRYTNKIKELTEQRSRLVGGTRNSNYQSLTDDIMRWTSSLEGAKKKLAELNEQKNQPVASESLKKSTQDAHAFETALGRIETAIGGLKSGMSVNLTGDFSKWVQEVQNVTASVRELVEQLQKMHNASTTALQATQQLSQAEQKRTPQGGLFDPQKFTTLQDAIDKIISEINRLQQAFARLGENSSLSNLSTMINGLAVTLSTLSNAIKIQPLDEQVKALLERCEKAEAKLREVGDAAKYLNERAGAKTQQKASSIMGITGTDEEQLNKVSSTAERFMRLLVEIENQMAKIGKIQALGEQAGFSPTLLKNAQTQLDALKKMVESTIKGTPIADGLVIPASNSQLGHFIQQFGLLKAQYRDIITEADRFNKATEKGSSQAEARIRKLGMAFNELKNYMKANGGSEEMRRLQSEIQVAIQKMRQLMNAGNFAGAINVYERLSGIIRQAATATKEFERSQQGVSSSVSHANANLQQQSQILTDLKSMAMQYLSVWGAQSFINNIIELGGQLEQQRLSIGAILQDTAQANHLFGQIKDLAIKSPFGVQQLDAMSKQLSAYGFQYSELYEWTKRLADISAATGTSVDRLALALGHVRAEGALSGYTLRQFSMGNIPLLQKLSENLGKTKQEIRKMTRAKEIGYEDVLNVLKQLTDEGGMFYEAQETMSQALNAKFKNLRDSFQIMYSEMAEGAPGDFLKGVATVLTDISKSWRVLMPLILSGAGALGVWKLATMALNHELQRTERALMGNAIATSKYSVSQLRAIATTGRWSLALRGLGNALKSIGKFIFNPVTLGFAAVEGLIYLWSRHNDEVRKAADLTKAYGEAAVESEKNISKQLEKIKPFSVGMDDSSLKAGVDSMIETVKNYAINGQGVINQMMIKDDEGKIMSLAEKYKYLRNELEETKKVYKELNKIKDAFEYGINTSDSGWFDDNVETNLTKYANAYKKFIDDVTTYNSKYGDSIEKAITNAEKSDSAFREATKNLTSYGEKLAVFWSNPDKYKNAFQYMNNLFGSGAGTGDALSLNESFFNYVKERDEAMNELDQFIENTEKKLKEKGYDFSKELAPEQVGALLKMSKDWLDKHPEWENIYDVIKGKLKGRWGIEIVPDAEALPEQLSGWQQEIQNWLDENGLKIQINPTDSHEDFIKKVKSLHEAAQTAMDNSGKVLIGIGFKLDNLPSELPSPLATPWNQSNLDTYNEKKGVVDKIEQLKKRFNFSWKEKGSKSKGSGKNPNTERAKAVREQVRVIKEAADAFQYWREKVGDKGAWEHVQKEFGDVLAKIGITADNIEDVRTHLNRIPQMKEYKAITDKKVKTEIDKEIAKENDQFIRKDFERDTERFLSKTQLQLDNLTRSWETFNAVREATGNVRLAVELSGADYENGETQNLADSIKKKIQRDFDQAGSVGIPFDINLSDREIKESIEKAMPAAAEDQLKGLIEEYKKWRDLQRDVLKRDINTFAKLVGSAKDYNSQIKKINDNLKQQIEANNRLVDIGVLSAEEAMRANSMATVQAEDEKWKLSFTYSQLMNNSLALTRSEVENGITQAVDMLNQKMKAGLITAQEFAEEMAKIQNVRSEWTNSPISGAKNSFTAGLFGGFEGRRSYLQAQMKQTAEAMARELQKLSGGGGTFDAAAYDRLYKKYQGDADKLNRLDSFKSLTDKFQALSKTLDPVIDLFNKLGMSEVGQVLGIGQNALQSAASTGMAAATVFGQDAGPWGMAAGAAISLVGGLFSMMDSALQEEIDASKARQKEMETLTKNLEMALERTLGGVYRTEASTEDRKKLEEYRARYWGDAMAAELYSKMWGGNGLSKEAKEFYKNVDDAFKKAMDTNSYYDTQRAFLYAQKYELEEQMRAEQDKKSSDDNAIADYKQQLAELEDQIKYFALDMAKALYDIDIQSWASDLTDAIVEAWENGEDAAEAYTNKVKDLMKDLTKNILAKKVMEKAFENAGIDKLIADMMDRTSGKLDYTLIPELSKALAQAGQDSTDIITSVLDELERMGYIEKGEGSGSGSVTSGIKSITENTADLLASYINAIRADVSVNRAMIAQYFPLYYTALTSSNQSLRGIENNTAAIMRSNEVVADKITSLDDNIKGLRNNTWRVPVS